MPNVMFQGFAWTDDTKTNLLTTNPITRFQRVFRHMEMSQPYEYELTVMLTDKQAANIGRGNYLEIYAGKLTATTSYPPSGQSLWCSGYVEQIVKSVSRSNEYQITLHSASLFLSHRQAMGALEMDYPTYQNMLDALNGVGSSPGKLGILSGSGWVANWIHSQGAHIPGAGDSWRTDWASMLANVNAMCQMYGLRWRERLGSTGTSGTIDMGAFNDSSGITYYGGDALATVMGVSGRPNVQLAQQAGYNIIESAEYDEDTSGIINVCWPIGAGSGANIVFISGSKGFQGPPLNKSGATQYGWQKWQPTPGGTTYYIQSNNKQTYSNLTFALIAEQQQDKNWAYGVVDLTSVNGDQNNPAYGIREFTLVRKKTKDANVLLSEALGVLFTNSKPVSQWTITCKPARSTGSPVGVPPSPLPGQSVAVNYTGKVKQSIDIDNNPASATYGQYIGSGDFTYLSYPNTTDPGLINKAKTVIVMEDEWSGKQYTQTLTLGKMQKNVHDTLNALAEDFEDHRHHNSKKHSFTRHHLDKIPFLFSQNPDAWEDLSQSAVFFSPGASCVSNVPNDQFFDDHHSVEYTVTVTDQAQIFNFWFAKPTDGTLTSNIASRAYPMFRLAFKGFTPVAGQPGCGFFLNNTDGTGTPKGGLVNKHMFDGKGRLKQIGTYRVKVSWSGGKYEAHITRMENGSPVWKSDIAAIWHDQTPNVSVWGAIGWHAVGGNSNAQMGSIHMHPFTAKGPGHHGGNNGDTSQVHTGAHRHVHHDDAANTFLTTHRHHSSGDTHKIGGVVHGPFHPITAIVGSVSGTNPITVTFSGTLTKGSIKPGYIVYNATGAFCFVKDVLSNGNKKITGFTTLDDSANGFAANQAVTWDPLDSTSNPLHGGQGHKRFGIWNPPAFPGDPKEGWAIVDRAADAPNDGSADFVWCADGSMLKGDKPLTQANGAVINIAELIIGGSHLAHGLEKEGAVLFDAGEYDSTTQQIIAYSSGGSVTLTPNTTNFYNGGPTQIQGSWVDTTQDGNNVSGEADSILQLTAGTFSTVAYNTIRWFDQQILTEETDKLGNQIARTYKVKKDVTFSLPVYMGVQQTPTTMLLGSVSTFQFYDPATHKMFITMDDGTLASIVSGDTFILNPGGSDAETVTATGVDTANKAIILSANPVNAHTAGEIIVQKTSNGTAVQSFGQLDGRTTMNQVVAAIDAIAVGFYGYYVDLAGVKQFGWYRGYWGAPEYGALAPYAAAGSMAYLGHLPSNNDTDFIPLQCKAREIGLHWGQTLSKPPVTIVGVELAIYSANPGAGQTVYFDGHSQGHSGSKGKTPAASVTANNIKSAALKHKHKLAKHHADAHQHSDFTFWCDTGNVLHWETGTLVMHDGTTYTINGGTEDTPNTGLPGHAGDYLVFNTSGSSVQLADPSYGTVTVPAYSAAGGTGGQSTGFAVLSEGYPFHKKVTGATVKTGLPDTLVKLGKVGHTPDTYTGELPVHTHHGSGKKHGKHTRKGALGHKHSHPHMQTKHVHKNIVFSVTNSDTGPNAPGFCTVSWTAGSIDVNNNTTSYPITAGSINSVSAGGYLLYDSVAHPAGFTASTGADFTTDANVKWFQVGKLSTVKDAHTGQYYLHAMHQGSHQHHGSHHAKGSVGRGHHHNHNTPKHHHKDIVFGITTGSPATLTWGAGTLVDNNGASIASIAANGTGIAVAANQVLYFNGTTYAVANAGSIDFTADANVGLYVVGHFSATVDASGYLTLYGWHGGVNQVGSGQIRSGAVTRKHLNKHHITRGHFVNCTFQMSGGSGINAPTFNLVAHGSGHINFMPSDGTPNIDLGTGTVGVVGPPWPVQGGSNNCQGCIILYNDQATNNVGAFCAVAPSTDLTNDGATINGLPASQWMKIGHVSQDVDPVTGQYIFHSYLTGTHHNHSVHHAPKSHTRTHSHIHNPHKHHHHGTSFECIGSTFFCNYTTGGVTPTFTSTIQSTDGESYVLQPATFGVVAHDWVYVDISGVANGGNVTPSHANSSSFTPGTNHIVLCRISGSVDANGDLTTEGHHHNAHKRSPHHLKNNVIKSAHISTNAVQTAHIGSGQVQNANVGSGAIHSGNLSTQAGVLGVSAVDSFSAAANINWSLRNWAGNAPPAQGSLTGGNYGGFTSYMTHYMLEVSCSQNFDGSDNWGPWQRVRPYNKAQDGQAANNSSTNAANWVDPTYWVESGTSSVTTNAFIYVQQCDILTDGSMSVVYHYSWQGTGTVTMKVRFRAVFNVSS